MLSKNKASLLFGASLLFIVVSGLTALFAISQIFDSQQWVAHTQNVRMAIAQVNTLLSRAGRTRSEFIDNSDPARFQEYESVLGQIPPTLQHLEELTSDNPVQRARVLILRQFVDQRILLMRQSVALKTNGESTLQNQSDLTQKIIGFARQQDALSDQMLASEEALLDTRTNRLRHSERLVILGLSSSLITALIFLALYYRLLNRELASREHAQITLRTLSARILQIQDDERRKFSRELHDSLGQYLVGAKMNLDLLDRAVPGNSLIADCTSLITDALSETRTISHLLHPPLLDEAGFASAARWYLEGFSSRSGITTRIDIPDPWDRLPPLIETAMFRIVQESLTNIHKHSQSKQADVSVRIHSTSVRLKIRDQGQGIPARTLERFRNEGGHNGVGLAGMRERVRELGGQLEIQSSQSGTSVIANLPIPPHPTASQGTTTRATVFQPTA